MHHSFLLFETPFCRLLNALLTVLWHGLGGCGAKRKGLAAAAGGVGSMYGTVGSPEPALHSQLGKTDGEVTNLVSCDASVLYTRSSLGRSASWGSTFLATGTCNPGGVIFGPCSGGGQVVFRSWPLWEAGSRRHFNVPKKRGV